ncbi:hypothetical protein G7K_5790-t1 [Saitoella complicata NRRL Y-17804]|uniref:Uncharacterized protein n=1 Tax=Saitoella complicata (strain BCRC 22490 / CBS 7301 / JCM 7358 / NBRC 10748 / NRRL Y-17804) TaxID=698492 RepID=A0A0E9NP89_SAICN|nr:hypothetical protein G7K_5790-t1 [Saitoella complicata NRRL Y-17804]
MIMSEFGDVICNVTLTLPKHNVSGISDLNVLESIRRPSQLEIISITFHKMSAGPSITLSKVLSDLAALHTADPAAAAALASSASTPDAAKAVQPDNADDSTYARAG